MNLPATAGGYHMETRFQSTRNGSLPDLVTGIIDDVRTLIRQEVALGRAEMLKELNKTKQAAMAVGAGIAVAAVGVLFLLLLLVNLIHEAGGLPLWGSDAIVGGVLVVFGCIVYFVGKRRASEVHLVPRQTIESIKENVQWIKEQT
jgi:Putative Actinobacterial Holin-X, holin superfamily III